MRSVHVLVLVLIAAVFHFGGIGEARAQAARRARYYNRTATAGSRAGVSVERGAGAFERGSTPSAGDYDPLRPYTSHPSTAYSSAPPVARLVQRPTPPPAPRNYYPAARFGQSLNSNRPSPTPRGHCTPSRGGMLGR